MNLLRALGGVFGGRPRFEVRTVPVLDDVRAVLWMRPPRSGGRVACRAVFEFDEVPGVEPLIREDRGAAKAPTTPQSRSGEASRSIERVWVPPRIEYAPRTVRNPRFRVNWATSSRGPGEVLVRVA
jgi:hypothetical protein